MMAMTVLGEEWIARPFHHVLFAMKLLLRFIDQPRNAIFASDDPGAPSTCCCTSRINCQSAMWSSSICAWPISFGLAGSCCRLAIIQLQSKCQSVAGLLTTTKKVAPGTDRRTAADDLA